MSILIPKVILIGRRSHGQDTISWDDGRTEEYDVLQCVHCQFSWAYKPGSGAHRGWCRRCDGPVCGKSQCMTCNPIVQQMEDYDREFAAREASAPALWVPGQ